VKLERIVESRSLVHAPENRRRREGATLDALYLRYHVLPKIIQHVQRSSLPSTVRTVYASLTAMVMAMVFGPWLIKASCRELQIGQYIREEGPRSNIKKAGTPTRGAL